MACLQQSPCHRFTVTQDREYKDTDRPWSKGRALSERGKGEKQRDNALQYPPVHPDCCASDQFCRSMIAGTIVRADARRWIDSRKFGRMKM